MFQTHKNVNVYVRSCINILFSNNKVAIFSFVEYPRVKKRYHLVVGIERKVKEKTFHPFKLPFWITPQKTCFLLQENVPKNIQGMSSTSRQVDTQYVKSAWERYATIPHTSSPEHHYNAITQNLPLILTLAGELATTCLVSRCIVRHRYDGNRSL